MNKAQQLLQDLTTAIGSAEQDKAQQAVTQTIRQALTTLGQAVFVGAVTTADDQSFGILLGQALSTLPQQSEADALSTLLRKTEAALASEMVFTDEEAVTAQDLITQAQAVSKVTTRQTGTRAPKGTGALGFSLIATCSDCKHKVTDSTGYNSLRDGFRKHLQTAHPTRASVLYKGTSDFESFTTAAKAVQFDGIDSHASSLCTIGRV